MVARVANHRSGRGRANFGGRCSDRRSCRDHRAGSNRRAGGDHHRRPRDRDSCRDGGCVRFHRAQERLGADSPPNAAPVAKQVSISATDSTGADYKAMDFYEAVYARAPGADYFTTPLLTLIDKDFNIHPGVATKWDLSKDGLTWTFTLKQGLKWSDGTDVTANDFVQTFRYSADPKHAWEFTWYWSGVIKNYTEATKGTVGTDQIGVAQGSDPYTLVFTTEVPVPYMPAQLLYSWPLQAAALQKYGSGVYNTNPQTSATAGPYMLQEWSPDSAP